MAARTPGKQVNRSGLAETFGVVTVTVDSWVKKGCPFVERGGRGKEWVFDTADIARWLRDMAAAEAGGDNTDSEEIERRTKRAKMSMVELELLEAQGKVAPVAEFERVQASRYAMIRQNVMNVPQRAVLQLLGCTNEKEFKAVLRRELTTALETAATAAIDLQDADTEDDAA